MIFFPAPEAKCPSLLTANIIQQLANSSNSSKRSTSPKTYNLSKQNTESFGFIHMLLHKQV